MRVEVPDDAPVAMSRAYTTAVAGAGSSAAARRTTLYASPADVRALRAVTTSASVAARSGCQPVHCARVYCGHSSARDSDVCIDWAVPP